VQLLAEEYAVIRSCVKSTPASQSIVACVVFSRGSYSLYGSQTLLDCDMEVAQHVIYRCMHTCGQ
jgi:hypothetical protein